MPFGLHDPTCRKGPGELVKAGRTPGGPVTLWLRRTGEGVDARAWGDGAGWVLERAPALLGLEDDPTSVALPEPMASLNRRWQGLRLPRSPWLFDGLVEYVLQQRVSFRDAARAHRRLLRALGVPAPGPAGLQLPLSPEDWRRLDPRALFVAGIDGRRARTLRAAAQGARRLERVSGLGRAEVRAVLATLPGCGPWTVGITMGFVVGDLHLPHEVGWALAGEPGADDRRMLELLEPYRGQRFRVLRLLLAAGRLHLGRATGGPRRPGAPP